MDINREIANRINNVKSLLPIWLKWNYVRPLFIMPNGTKPEGVKAAGNEYNAHRGIIPSRSTSTGAEEARATSCLTTRSL